MYTISQILKSDPNWILQFITSNKYPDQGLLANQLVVILLLAKNNYLNETESSLVQHPDFNNIFLMSDIDRKNLLLSYNLPFNDDILQNIITLLNYKNVKKINLNETNVNLNEANVNLNDAIKNQNISLIEQLMNDKNTIYDQNFIESVVKTENVDLIRSVAISKNGLFRQKIVDYCNLNNYDIRDIITDPIKLVIYHKKQNNDVEMIISKNMSLYQLIIDYANYRFLPKDKLECTEENTLLPDINFNGYRLLSLTKDQLMNTKVGQLIRDKNTIDVENLCIPNIYIQHIRN